MLVDEKIKDIRHVDNRIVKTMCEDKVLWEFPQDDKIGAPGNRTLLAGNMDAGWFGEVPSSDFITGDELAKKIGLTAGNSQYSNEPWLKFAYKREVHLVAKKPFRYSISWTAINAVNAVYGDRLIEIKGKKYAVMLMRGTGEDVQPDPKTIINRYNGIANHNSMWNKLMLPIHQKAPSNWTYPNNVKSPTENWNIGYTDSDLCINNVNGASSWCQDRLYYAYCYCIRGGDGISYSILEHKDSADSIFGWRPVLKIIG